MKYFDWLLNNVNSDLDSKIEELERVLTIRDNQIEGLREEIKSLNSMYDTEVIKYSNTIGRKDRELGNLKLDLARVEGYVNKLRKIEIALNQDKEVLQRQGNIDKEQINYYKKQSNISLVCVIILVICVGLLNILR